MTGRYPKILDQLGRGCPVKLDRVGGGCIADARVAVFADGSQVFIKTLENAPGMFECEATGLRELARAGAIRVPEVLAVGNNALVLELIRATARRPDFFESFGRAFAHLHQHHGPGCGFSQDNFIGSTPQHNAPLAGDWESLSGRADGTDDGSSWPGFFLQRRLRFQVRLAAERGHGQDLTRLLDRAEDRITGLLGASTEPPSLLHGDLWGGNFIVDEKGEACLIDPAVYYGHREADLAMTRLFGGFEPAFYQSYCEVSPLQPGHEERLPVYQLYHLLNHLNLFGAAYYSQCSRILQRYSESSG
ncbi:MAG: phosphotransferase [Xanthomonadales bacterium]|nr:fructosamine kinase family protein [Gammaproteobacteria bacterium]NNK50322.1 phosphotransferase [Xanthomonadales bacterium]